MTEQQDNPRRSVAVPVVMVLIAVAAFAAAFYFLDGIALVDDMLGTTLSNGSQETSTIAAQEAVPDEPVLELPDGMTEEFALRIWQEQIDSQSKVVRLARGEIERLEIGGSSDESTEDEVARDIVAEFSDGTTAPGVLGMHALGGSWYFAYVSGVREGFAGGMADDVNAGDGGAPTGELPDIEDVDVGLLNTMLEQQAASASVLEEYAAGKILEVIVDDLVEAPGTVTLEISMRETHETGHGQIVLISKEINGETLWFIARFTKVDVQ